jgi:hypothetical protein
MATILLKFGPLIAGAVACVACMICTGTAYGWGKDVMNKSTDTKKIANEKNSTIAFCVIMIVFLGIRWGMKKFI